MRKNYFAKKFVAYSMAFAVAFSTLTVSPVFVKEAKAADAYTADWVEDKGPSNKIADDEAIWIESMTSDNSAGTEITPSIFAKGVGVTVDQIGSTTVSVGVDSASLTKATATVTKDGEGKVTGVATVGTIPSSGADSTDSGTIEEVVIDGKDASDIVLTAAAAGFWYKLEPQPEGTFLVGKDTVTYKYYKLRKLNTTASATYNVKRASKNLGLYISANADGCVKSLHYLNEVTKLTASSQKDEVLVQKGSTAKISVTATHKSTRGISYKWSKDGVELKDNKDSFLTFTNVTADDFGVYRCDVTDGVEKKIVTVELAELKNADVVTANASNAATTFETSACVLVSPGGKLYNNSAILTSSLPKGDYKYIWLNATKDDALPMYETDKLAYDSSNNSIKVTDDTNSYTSVYCYAVPTSVYNANQTIAKKLKDVAEATSPSDKGNKINALRTAEVALATTAGNVEYIEKFNLYVVDDSVKYSTEYTTVKFGQTLTLDAVEATSEDNHNIEYQWYRGGTKIATGSKYVIDTVDVTDLGTIMCKAVECKTDHTCDPTKPEECDFAIGASNLLFTTNYNLVYVSDLTATTSDVTAKDGEKNVVLNTTATSSLDIDYKWAEPTDLTIARTTTTPGKYTISKINGTNHFYSQTGEAFKCKVTDGIRTIILPIKVNQVETYTVFLNEKNKSDNKPTKGQTLATAENNAKFVGLAGDSTTLAPIVVAANEETEKALTYKWTKNTINGTVVSTDKEFTTTYPKTATPDVYVVTISDGITKVSIEYTLGLFDPKTKTIDTDTVKVVGGNSKVVYNGNAQNPLMVTADVTVAAVKSTIILKENVDYTIEVAENVNVGTAFYSNVKLIGDYAGECGDGYLAGLKGVFYIVKADNKLEIADKTVTLGQSVQPATVTNLSKGTLTYTYYADADCTTEIDVPNKVGTYYVKATSVATANYNEATSNVATIKIASLGKTKIGSTSRTASSVKLPWTKVEGATKYRVYKKAAGASSYTKVADTTALSYNVTGLASATTYTFAVKAYGEGGWATVYATKTTTTAPAKVAKPTVTAGSKKATVKFTKVARATGYQIYMAKGNGSYKKVATTKNLSFTKTGLAKGATYKFKVRAYKTVGSNTYYGAFSSAKAVVVK